MNKNKASKNEEIQICEHCNTEISGDDVRYFDGQVLCIDCLDNQTTFCSHCGERIWHDNNVGTVNLPYGHNNLSSHYSTKQP